MSRKVREYKFDVSSVIERISNDASGADVSLVGSTTGQVVRLRYDDADPNAAVDLDEAFAQQGFVFVAEVPNAVPRDDVTLPDGTRVVWGQVSAGQVLTMAMVDGVLTITGV